MYVILHMSVITQLGVSALMCAAKAGRTEVVVELVKAGANVDLHNVSYVNTFVVHMYTTYRNTHHCSRLNYHTLQWYT